ncbi:MAG: hypothetical protein DRO88_03105 [Promethearchaeia archaeon]|nr:MAG: hypothetical protein DRO88_03105 [Candidatus Lokiarchaeia archaeon]
MSLKILLIYFSGTGSTAEFALNLGDFIQEKGNTVDYIRLTRKVMEKSKENFDKYDLIGFGSPVWSWRTPRIITRYVSTLKLPKIPYFNFFSCGGSLGNAPWSLYKALRNSGGIYLGTVIATGTNNIRSWRPKLDKPGDQFNELNSTEIQTSQKFISSLLELLHHQELKEGPAPPRIWYWSLVNSVFSYPFEMRKFVGTKKINQEKCTKCGLCATRICPSNAISIGSDGFPQINEKLCYGCHGCINLCPTLAINTKLSQSHHPFTNYGKNILKSF